MSDGILIVDDDPGALKLLYDILSAENYAVRPFSTAELALRSIMAEAPELIVLDICMPGMDGFDVCHRIKKNPKLNDTPVIFISAASDVGDKVKAFQAGGVDYITKPFQREEVIARIKTHVALNRSLQELKRMGEALRQSEESLKIAQSIAQLGHWEWDVVNGTVVWSEEMYRILGINSQDLPATYDSILQVVHPEDRERVAAQLNRVFAGNGFDIEYRVLLPGGRVRVVHGKGEVVCLSSTRQSKMIGTIQEIPGQEQMKMLGVIQDITERKELESQLQQQANTDYLTGCSSRRHFLEQARQGFAHARRYGGGLSVLMLDLDHFKVVNDSHGHQVGDATLKVLVQVCLGILREVDVVGRLGGEEFAVLLPETRGEKALEIAERLRSAVAAAEVPLEGGEALHFTTSIGVSFLLANDTKFDAILDRADRALYAAKNSGRNRVCAIP
ncbi:MAG: diguanylate cyclase [Sulfuricella sp.]